MEQNPAFVDTNEAYRWLVTSPSSIMNPLIGLMTNDVLQHFICPMADFGDRIMFVSTETDTILSLSCNNLTSNDFRSHPIQHKENNRRIGKVSKSILHGYNGVSRFILGISALRTVSAFNPNFHEEYVGNWLRAAYYEYILSSTGNRNVIIFHVNEIARTIYSMRTPAHKPVRLFDPGCDNNSPISYAINSTNILTFVDHNMDGKAFSSYYDVNANQNLGKLQLFNNTIFHTLAVNNGNVFLYRKFSDFKALRKDARSEQVIKYDFTITFRPLEDTYEYLELRCTSNGEEKIIVRATCGDLYEIDTRNPSKCVLIRDWFTSCPSHMEGATMTWCHWRGCE